MYESSYKTPFCVSGHRDAATQNPIDTLEKDTMHKALSSIEELPYCFGRLSVKFQGRMR